MNADPHPSEKRCRWCGRHLRVLGFPCRARLAGDCEEWVSPMPRWPQFIELDEYVNETTFAVESRSTR